MYRPLLRGGFGSTVVPALKTTLFPRARCPPDIQSRRCTIIIGGIAFLPHGVPKITAEVHLQSCTESGLLLLTLLRAGIERFLPSASGSSAAGLKPCVNQRASSSLNLSHRFTSALAGDPCMGFVVGASERKATGSKESAQIHSNWSRKKHSSTPFPFADRDSRKR